MAAGVVAGIVSLKEPAIVYVWSLKCLGKGSFCGAWSKRFANYKPKYFSRRNKSTKSTYFR